jgi:hypothetical protein
VFHLFLSGLNAPRDTRCPSERCSFNIGTIPLGSWGSFSCDVGLTRLVSYGPTPMSCRPCSSSSPET